MTKPRAERSPLPKLLPCICGTKNAPRPYRRGSATKLWAVSCNVCKRRAPAHGDPVRMYENWNTFIAELVRRDAFKS